MQKYEKAFHENLVIRIALCKPLSNDRIESMDGGKKFVINKSYTIIANSIYKYRNCRLLAGITNIYSSFVHAIKIICNKRKIFVEYANLFATNIKQI